jgi:hypothetical protein
MSMGSCDDRITLYPAAPLRLATLLHARTIAREGCKYAPNIAPTSSSAHPVDIVRIFRMAEEPAPALVATPHEAPKTVLDQTLRSKRQGINIAPDFTLRAIKPLAHFFAGFEKRH